MEIRIPKNVYSTISYRGLVKDALREAGKEHEGDMFFNGSFIHYKEFGSPMDSCVAIAKKYGVETIWE